MIFGRLTIIQEAPRKIDPSGRVRRQMYCECICGQMKTARLEKLIDKETTSCGCFRREMMAASKRSLRHGHSAGGKLTYLYRTWSSMKARCYMSSCKSYPHYGGRGITVCQQWKNDFAAFAAYVSGNLGNRPEKYSIDRINNDGNYEPGNIRWASSSTQNRNQRRRFSSQGII